MTATRNVPVKDGDVPYDGRAGRRRLWASATSMHWGGELRSSDDFGKTWTTPAQANVKFPPDAGLSLANIWQIRVGCEIAIVPAVSGGTGRNSDGIADRPQKG